VTEVNVVDAGENEKAPVPMEVTLAGMVMDDNPVTFLKA
jgi:hypothetical protein